MARRTGRVRSFRASCAAAATTGGAWLAFLLLCHDPAATQAVSNLGQALAALAAAGQCAWAARSRSGRERRAWGLFAASALSWGLGQTVWAWYESVAGREVPFPSLADVGYLGAVPFAVAALLSLPAAPERLASLVRTVVDGLVVAGSLLLVSWAVVIGPLFRSGTGSLLAQAISLAYPVGDVVTVTLVSFAVARSRRGGGLPSGTLGLLAAGLVAVAVADSGFTYLTVQEGYASGSAIDAGWFAGYVLLLLAARRPVPAAAVRADDGLRPSVVALPYVAVVLALSAAWAKQAAGGGLDAFLVYGLLVVVALVVVRHVLTLAENLVLTRHLEERVRARTAELRESEERFRSLARNSSDVVSIVDADGTVRYASDSITKVFGYEPASVVGRRVASQVHPGDRARLLELLAEMPGRPTTTVTTELRVQHRQGHWCDCETTVTNLLSDPSVAGLVLNTRDVSERKRLEEQLSRQAFFDSLTGLANRALFKNRIEHALAQRDPGRRAVAVLYLDLDGFKGVNDSLGHAYGDRLLAAVGARLSACVRPGDTVARLGGDEFAVLVEDVVAEPEVAVVAGRILEALREPLVLDGQEVFATASVGMALADGGDESPDDLLRNADLAMHRAKSRGAGGYRCYEPGMHAAVVERLELEADLRRALERDELVLHYQPTVEVASERIVGVEALVRWQHPSRGLLPPAQFVSLAEETGLIVDVGRWVLAEACRQVRAWQVDGVVSRPFTVAVNVSGHQVLHGDLVADVASAIDASGLSPADVVLEVTESVLVEGEETLATLHRLRATGCRLAIDDFGTGYSSLSYLHRFPADILKIDRSFVERLARADGTERLARADGTERLARVDGTERLARADDAAHATAGAEEAELASSIVRIGQSLGLETVAEGVEDADQLEALRAMGCDLAQGYHFSRPLPAAEVEALLDRPAGRVAAPAGR